MALDTSFGSCAAVVRRVDAGSGDIDILAWDAPGGTLSAPLRWNAATGSVAWHNGVAQSVAPTITLGTSDEWALLVATKATGTLPPRFHKYSYLTRTWTHESGTTALADNAAGATSAVIGRNRTTFPPTGILAQFSGITDAQTLTAFDAGNWATTAGYPSLVGTTASSIRSSGSYCGNYWLTDLGSPNNEVFATLGALSSTSNDFLMARVLNPASSTTRTGYGVEWKTGLNEFRIYKVTAGTSYAQLTSVVVAPLAVGDAILFRVSGAAPAVLDVYTRRSGFWTLALSYSDSASPLTTGNFIAIESQQTTLFWDDFGGGATAGSANNRRDIAAVAWWGVSNVFSDVDVEQLIDPANWSTWTPLGMWVLDREKVADRRNLSNEISRGGTTLVSANAASNIYLPAHRRALRDKTRILTSAAKDALANITISGGGAPVAVGAKGALAFPLVHGGGTMVVDSSAKTGAAVFSGGGAFTVFSLPRAVPSPTLWPRNLRSVAKHDAED